MRWRDDTFGGKLCFRKHLNTESVIKLYKNFEDDLIETYLINKSSRLAAYPIIDAPVKK